MHATVLFAGLPQEADAFQRQVQTADAHEGTHQGEAVSVRGKPQTYMLTNFPKTV